jgi:hypothetical protein
MFIKLQPLFFLFLYTIYFLRTILFLISTRIRVLPQCYMQLCSYAQLIHFLVIYPILLYCNLHFLYMSTCFIDFNLPTSIRTLYILPFIFIVQFIFSSLFQYRHQSIQHRNFCNTSQSLDW